MEKQHNRGQDGAGVVNIKLDMPAGSRYFNRFRSNGDAPIKEVFQNINAPIENELENNPEKLNDEYWVKRNIPFAGELLLGHLRYGTYGKNSIEYCHPVLRQNNWKTRNIALAGNFNLTNVDELFQNLLELGQHPREKSDTVTVLEKIGHFLDEENEKLFNKFRDEGYSKREITSLITDKLDVKNILQKSVKSWDGGYVIG
ncbi:MAG: amidophosphoribosyltransferase, partial [Bacteroidia bacterium]|nr:amidophosphoribosyltransferase [Bacteroidia bacterium]